jgi:hypothetical protein
MLKASLNKVAARSVDDRCNAIGTAIEQFTTSDAETISKPQNAAANERKRLEPRPATILAGSEAARLCRRRRRRSGSSSPSLMQATSGKAKAARPCAPMIEAAARRAA